MTQRSSPAQHSAPAQPGLPAQPGSPAEPGSPAQPKTVPPSSPAQPKTVPPNVRGYVAAGDKEALAKRMHRIEGQVRGIEKMIAEDRYCIDILTQISAVSTALEAVAYNLLDDHVNHCVAGALASGDERVANEKSRELLEAVYRFVRSR
jgi:DNA-binding FrmR family transcriptional regulator